jgi:hypothetical protein
VTGRLGRVGLHHPEPAGPADAASILELVATAEGQTSAAVAEHWLDVQPGGFLVVRGEDDEVRGCVALLDLTAASEQERRADPRGRGGMGVRPPVLSATTGRGDHSDAIRGGP